jgi:outer membrane lipoprotein-sorting protein
MRADWLLLVALLLWAGCPKDEGNASGLLSRVRAGLAEREKKVASYRFDGVIAQAEERICFSVAFRAPRMTRVEMKESGIVYAFDGQRFSQWDPRQKTLTLIDLAKEPRLDGALFLHEVFSPFSPEGWRSPLLAGNLVAAADAAGTVAVEARANDGADEIEVRYLFALPAMDFVGKSVRGGSEVRIKDRHCEKELGLCFPTVIEERPPGQPALVTTLQSFAINVPIPAALFEPQAPEGWSIEHVALPTGRAR